MGWLWHRGWVFPPGHPVTLVYGVTALTLLMVGVVALFATWIPRCRKGWLASAHVQVRMLYVGLVGAVAFLPVEYARYGLLGVVPMVLGGPPLIMWLSIERHRSENGQPVWVSAFLVRVILRYWLRRPGKLDHSLGPAVGHFLTIDQIRDEYAQQILADAIHDPNLDELLVRTGETILGQVRMVQARSEAELAGQDLATLQRRAILLGRANALVDEVSASGPFPLPDVEPYRDYPDTTVWLAAACRLADNHKLLAS